MDISILNWWNWLDLRFERLIRWGNNVVFYLKIVKRCKLCPYYNRWVWRSICFRNSTCNAEDHENWMCKKTMTLKKDLWYDGIIYMILSQVVIIIRSMYRKKTVAEYYIIFHMGLYWESGGVKCIPKRIKMGLCMSIIIHTLATAIEPFKSA